MSDDVFISYSRTDQEFVTRLASDLNAKVTGVWFDQADIKAGQRWRDQIVQGIRDSKVVILVLSPASAASQYVQMELNLALEQQKRIIPILYEPVRLTDSLEDLVHETQYIDLRRGSYADNFQTLVDGLIAAGAARQAHVGPDRPFLRKSVPTDWGAVIARMLSWALAWSLGWAVFGIALLILFRLLNTNEPFNSLSLVIYPIAGVIGGLVGGLAAGFISMLALRRFAPSISWKHISPAIRIWALSGPLGLAFAIGLMRLIFTPSTSNGDCGLNIGCIIGTSIGMVLVNVLAMILLVFFFVTIAWFLTGVFAGWLAARHIRRLEPGMTRGQFGWVMFGWGVGALVGGLGTVIALAVLSQMFGLS